MSSTIENFNTIPRKDLSQENQGQNSAKFRAFNLTSTLDPWTILGSLLCHLCPRHCKRLKSRRVFYELSRGGRSDADVGLWEIP